MISREFLDRVDRDISLLIQRIYIKNIPLPKHLHKPYKDLGRTRRIIYCPVVMIQRNTGDTIAVPNDTTNEARALLLLQDNGVITLKDGAGLEATVKDIEENPKNIKIEELEAAQVARVTGETAYVVLNGNYALEAGFSVGKDALAYEKSDSEAAKTYVNVIAVKEGNEDSEKIQALVDVLKSDEIKDFINEKYDGAVIPFEESSDAEETDTEDADDADSKDADNADDTAEENADTTDTAEDAE